MLNPLIELETKQQQNTDSIIFQFIFPAILRMDIITKINSRIDKLLFIQNNNDKVVLKPNVCCICDKLLKYNKINYITQTLWEANKKNCSGWKRIDDNIELNIKQ